MSAPWLRLRDAASPEEIGTLGISFARTDLGGHSGILHRAAKGELLRLTHLEFHHRLKDEAAGASEAFAAFAIPRLLPGLAENVAAVCRLVVAQHPRGEIPYGLRYRASIIDDNGSFVPSSDEHGLTCATFVLAVFRRAGIELLDLETWSARDDDLEFQRTVVEWLESQARKGRVDPAHVEKVRGEIGCFRYRPAEVIGACAHHTHPVAFDRAVEAAHEVNEALKPRESPATEAQ